MAVKYFRNVGTNFNTDSNWSLSSGGPNDTTAPTILDTARFDANSGNCTMTASADVLSWDCTGYLGTFSFGVGVLSINNGTATLGAGMTTASVTGFIRFFGTCSLVSSGVTLNSTLDFNTSTCTLSDNWTVKGLSVSNPCTINGSTINVLTGGVVNIGQATIGTTIINPLGTNTLTSGGACGLPLVINTLGAITFSSICAFRNINYMSAASVTTTGSTLSSANANCTWNTAGIVWNNVTIGAGVITLNSKLTASAMNVGGANTVSFVGTAGFEVGSYISAPGTARTVNFTAGRSYIVNNSLALGGAGRLSMVSTSPGAVFTLNPAATQNVFNTNATWLDSSAGQTIYTNVGELSNTINWNLLGVGAWPFFM